LLELEGAAVGSRRLPGTYRPPRIDYAVPWNSFAVVFAFVLAARCTKRVHRPPDGCRTESTVYHSGDLSIGCDAPTRNCFDNLVDLFKWWQSMKLSFYHVC
jgi:hypothetical protein